MSLRLIVITEFPISKVSFIAIPTRTSDYLSSSTFSSPHPRGAALIRAARDEQEASVPLIKSLEPDGHVSPGSQKRREIGQVAGGKGTMRAGGKGKGRMREDWYRPRVQGHECEGYRTSLPPGRANLSDTVRRHSLFHAQKEDGGREEEEEEQRERGNVKEEEKRTNRREREERKRESIFQHVELV